MRLICIKDIVPYHCFLRSVNITSSKIIVDLRTPQIQIHIQLLVFCPNKYLNINITKWPTILTELSWAIQSKKPHTSDPVELISQFIHSKQTTVWKTLSQNDQTYPIQEWRLRFEPMLKRELLLRLRGSLCVIFETLRKQIFGFLPVFFSWKKHNERTSPVSIGHPKLNRVSTQAKEARWRPHGPERKSNASVPNILVPFGVSILNCRSSTTVEALFLHQLIK